MNRPIVVGKKLIGNDSLLILYLPQFSYNLGRLVISLYIILSNTV